MKKKIIIIFSLLITLALAGCLIQKQVNQAEQNQLSQQSSITPTSTSIPTPIPEPTNTPTPTEKIEAVRTFTDNDLVLLLKSFDGYDEFNDDQIQLIIESEEFETQYNWGKQIGDVEGTLKKELSGQENIEYLKMIIPELTVYEDSTPTPEPTATSTPIPTNTPAPEPTVALTPTLSPTSAPTPTPVIKEETETPKPTEKPVNVEDFTYETPITADLTYEGYEYIMKLREEHYGASCLSVNEMPIADEIRLKEELRMRTTSPNYKKSYIDNSIINNDNPVITDNVREEIHLGRGTKETFTITVIEDEYYDNDLRCTVSTIKEITLNNVSGDYYDEYGYIFFIPDGLGLEENEGKFDSVVVTTNKELFAWQNKYPDASMQYISDENGNDSGAIIYMHELSGFDDTVFDLNLRGY